MSSDSSYGANEEEQNKNNSGFFEEKLAIIDLINELLDTSDDAFQGKYPALEKYLIKYQEQPTLLAPHMQELLDPLNSRLVDIATAVDRTDAFTQDDVSASPNGLHRLCKIIHLLCRVRGYKHVIKLFPHEAEHLEPCLILLRSQKQSDYANWETRYSLLLWLSILCLIPFDICSIDSSIDKVSTTDATLDSLGRSNYVGSVISIGTSYLSNTGPTRDAASICLSALLTRPDMELTYLNEFVTWAIQILKEWAAKSEEEMQDLTLDSFRIIGVLNCLAQIFKRGHRYKLLPFLSSILEPCLAISKTSSQMMSRKLLTKLLQRMGMTYLPPIVADWRYLRGKRSLESNLNGLKAKAAEHNDKTAEDPNKISESAGEDPGDFEMPGEMDEIIENILVALGDKDTIVRWSAAKGIGRITMRLPKDFADDIVAAVIDSFSDPNDDANWHGGCLALAELSRRGLLLPNRLHTVVPLIVRAIHFDVLRGQHSVGSHVRDAACYVCWAFARAYSPLVMKPFIAALSDAMLLTALFDREVNCRRAASAAFQENVGRQGNESFPNGIEIITIADYFSVGNRTSAYLKLASSIALLDTETHSMCHSFLHHLQSVSLVHWDEEVRVLSSKALAELSKQSPEYALAVLGEIVNGCLSTQINVRHGCILGVSEIYFALTSIGVEVPKELALKVIEVPEGLDKARLYRGRGGELVRFASCYLIESIAQSNVQHLTGKQKFKFVDLLNDNIRQPYESVQKAAVSAMRCILFVYFHKNSSITDATKHDAQDVLLATPVVETCDTPIAAPATSTVEERVRNMTLTKYMEGLLKEDNVAVTRGYALALGALPVGFVVKPAGTFQSIISCLKRVTDCTFLVCGEPDANTRANALESMAELFQKAYPFQQEFIDLSCLSDIIEVLVAASDDYSVDKRGDTGSWCRTAALLGMERLLRTICTLRVSSTTVSPSISSEASLAPTRVEGSGNEPGILHPVALGSLLSTSHGVGRLLGYQHVGATYSVINVSNLFEDMGFLKNDNEACIEIVMTNKALQAAVVTDPFSFSARDELAFERTVEDITLTVFRSIFKQLAEKLDAVRDVAGNILMRLVFLAQSASSTTVSPSGLTSILTIPDNTMVLRSVRLHSSSLNSSGGPGLDTSSGTLVDAKDSVVLDKEEALQINWSQPNHVFPIIGNMLDSDCYFHTFFSGLVISMGGLTEAVQKESTKSFVEYFLGKRNTNGFVDRVNLLLSSFLQVFQENSKVDRVILPTLKAFELVIRNGLLEHLYITADTNETLQALHRAVLFEMKSCSNIPKLFACIDLLALFVWFSGLLRYSSLQHLANTLIYKYPRARVYCAEVLYMVTLSDAVPVGPSYEEFLQHNQTPGVDELEKFGLCVGQSDLDSAQSSISETSWNAPDKLLLVGKRDEIKDLLRLNYTTETDESKAVSKGGTSKKKVQKIDELDSYSALVREAGY